MSPGTNVARVLTDIEWQIIIDLLEREQAQLPAEIHHAFHREAKQELRLRERTIDELLAKLRTYLPSQERA